MITSVKMCSFPFLCLIGEYLHVCKLSVCLKKSCMSSALSLAIALHAKIVFLILEFEILKKFFECLTPQFSIASIIEDQVSSEDCELTFEQY